MTTGTLIPGTETPLNAYLGVCEPCRRPLRVATPAGATCPDCQRRVKVSRLLAIQTDESCDARCMGAVGPSCSCGCGGANHGKSWAVGTTEITEEALAKYRARRDREDAARAAKAAKARQRKLDEYAAWAEDTGNTDLVQWLTTADLAWSDFLTDMANIVLDHKPLTERQAAAARRAMDKIKAREAARAARDAALDANRTDVPTGKAITVEGEIIAIRDKDNPYTGGTTWEMTVQGDGWRVTATAPRSLIIPAGAYSSVDFQAHLKGLHGKRVRFVADVEVSRRDSALGYGKRPRKTELLASATA